MVDVRAALSPGQRAGQGVAKELSAADGNERDCGPNGGVGEGRWEADGDVQKGWVCGEAKQRGEICGWGMEGYGVRV